MAIVVFAMPPGTAATTLDEIDRLVDVGAVSLALRVIDLEQPAYAASAVAWQHWERRRLAILESQQRWPAIVARVAGYDASLADDFWIAGQEAAARAQLASGNADAARAILAGLIWGTAQDTARVDQRARRLRRWRATLAESYLLAGQLADAQSSALRYRQDYAGDPRGWRLEQAKALLRAGRNNEARALLVGLDSTEVAYLKLLLRARNISVDPVELLSEMAPFLGEERLVAAERAQLWAALGAAAVRYRDHEIRVTAMEQALALRGAPVAARDRFVSVRAQALWEAYAAYAAALANASQLLVGRFDAWLALADGFSASGDVRARALYAYLSQQKRDPRVADRARAGLVSMLAREPRGLAILAALYLDAQHDSAHDSDLSAIPADVRVALMAYAAESSRPHLAEKLLVGVDVKAQQGLSARWRAPLAVALIGSGRVDEALALFAQDFASASEADPAAVDAAVSVAAALQAAGEDAHAAGLLSRALAVTSSAHIRRRLAFLAARAESRAGRQDRAARLYLESAAVPGGGAVDSWWLSARLEAARALARAGLAGDAENVLEATLADDLRPDQQNFLEQTSHDF
jgi:hypothetical protein